ncbi:MAG TPA: peroxiredoxin-like family protein [Terriglobales bacterium]|nr:peroxiredoxin-like family protein [Terriglobales bacterium]
MKWRSLQESSAGVDTRTLREQFAERKSLIAKYVPPEVEAVHARVIQELQEQGILERALPVGAPAPNFELQDHDDQCVSSTQLLEQTLLVICFFRGRWCPFCVSQLEAMNLFLPQIEAAGAVLLAISPQTVRQSFFMAEQHKLNFRLLSDGRNQVARQFGLVYRVPEYQQSVYRRAFVNLPMANGDDSWELPIPATYVVRRDGIVRYASLNPDYSVRPEPTEILNHLGRPDRASNSR